MGKERFERKRRDLSEKGGVRVRKEGFERKRRDLIEKGEIRVRKGEI